MTHLNSKVTALPSNQERFAHRYIGWVPCLAGHLFFRYTSNGLGLFDNSVKNELKREKISDSAQERLIVATSVVNLKDSGKADENGLFRIVLIAKEEKKEYISSYLQGELFFIHIKENKEQNKIFSDFDNKTTNELFNDYGIATSQQISETFDYLKNNPANTKNNLLTTPKEPNKRNHLLISNLKKLENSKIYKEQGGYVTRIFFHITSTGMAHIAFQETAITYKLNNKINIRCIHTGGKTEEKAQENSKRLFCEQAFYHLKYTLHNHTHHHNDNDSLTTIHCYRNTKAHNGEFLINDLRKALVEIKRSNGRIFYDSAGISTYGKSLVLSCEREQYLKTEKTQNHLAYFENQTESIRLRQEKREQEELNFQIRILRPLPLGNILQITSVLISLFSLMIISHNYINQKEISIADDGIMTFIEMVGKGENTVMTLIKMIEKGEYEVILALIIAIPIIIRLLAAIFLHLTPRIISLFTGSKLSRRSSIYEGAIPHRFNWAKEHARSAFNRKNRIHHYISYNIVKFFIWRLDFLNRIRTKRTREARKLSRKIYYGSYIFTFSFLILAWFLFLKPALTQI